MGLRERNNILLQTEHYKTLWCSYANVLIGCWLLTGHYAFGYSGLFAINDVVSGALLILFSFLSISYKRLWAPSACALVALWLQFSPILLWANLPAIYINETLTGAIVLAFSILIPGIPGKLPDYGPSIPPGWSYNPSSWPQRIPIVVLGMIGWFISRYLAAFQLGFIDTVWSPFFPYGTLDVITSTISQDFPISDAGLGSFAYTLEVLLALKGDERRWRTMPWMVLLFGLLVVPLSLTTIILIILQPLVVEHWCSLCLFTAFCMMFMIAFAIDEVVAVLQLLSQGRKQFWSLFWKGIENIGREDTRTPLMDESWKKIFPAMAWGVNMPIHLLLSALLGFWLMFTPWVFDLTKFLSDSDHVVGALTIIISVISMAEVIRWARRLNLFFGAYIILSTIDYFFSPVRLLSVFNHVVVGSFLILLSFPRGKVKESYGAWNRFVR